MACYVLVQQCRRDDVRTPRARIRCVNAACRPVMLRPGLRCKSLVQSKLGTAASRSGALAERSLSRPSAVISIACVPSWNWRLQGPLNDAPVEL